MLKPITAIAANAPMIVTGTVVAGTSVARQFCRKTMMTIEDERARFEKCAIDLADGLADKRGGIERNLISQARWESPERGYPEAFARLWR